MILWGCLYVNDIVGLLVCEWYCGPACIWMILWGCLYVNDIVELLVSEWYYGAACMWMILWGCLYLNDIVGQLVSEWYCGAACMWMVFWMGLLSEWNWGAACMWRILWGCLYLQWLPSVCIIQNHALKIILFNPCIIDKRFTTLNQQRVQTCSLDIYVIVSHFAVKCKVSEIKLLLV